MLRRKLMWRLGPLVLLLLITGVVAVGRLQGILQRLEMQPLSEYLHEEARAEQLAITRSLRALVLGLALVFVLVINVSVIMLLRMSGMILRPIDELVKATRRLGHERFDYRVTLKGNDEFDQLADAYNHLAERLQANEQRKIEMLHQAAITLNHELNNAVAGIELQLELISRQTAHTAAVGRCLREIHHSLHRMSRTVDALGSVRRIVLTNYLPGTKMLDLEQSMKEEKASSSARTTGVP